MILIFCVFTRQTALLCYDGNTDQCPQDYLTFNESNFANLDSLFNDTEARVLFCKSIPNFLENPLYIGENKKMLTFLKSDSLLEKPSISLSIDVNNACDMAFENIKVNFNVLDPNIKNYQIILKFINSIIYENKELQLLKSRCYTDSYSYNYVLQFNFGQIYLNGSFNKIYFDTNSSMNATYIYQGSEVLVYKPISSQNFYLTTDQVISISSIQGVKIEYFIYFNSSKGYKFNPNENSDLLLYIKGNFDGVITDFPQRSRLAFSKDSSVTLDFTDNRKEFNFDKISIQSGATLNITSKAHIRLDILNLYANSKMNLFQNINNTVKQIHVDVKSLFFQGGDYTIINNNYNASEVQTNKVTIIKLINTSFPKIVAKINYKEYTKIYSEDKNSSPSRFQINPKDLDENASIYFGNKYPFFCTKYMDCSKVDIMTLFLKIAPTYKYFSLGDGINLTCDVIDEYSCFEYQLTSNIYPLATITNKEYKTTKSDVRLFIIMAILSLISILVAIFIGCKT